MSVNTLNSYLDHEVYRIAVGLSGNRVARIFVRSYFQKEMAELAQTLFALHRNL